jgi:hypothetical protein
MKMQAMYTKRKELRSVTAQKPMLFIIPQSVRVRRFGVTTGLAHTCYLLETFEAFLRSVLRLLVTANVPSSLIFVILMMEAMCSYETSVLTRAARRHISEDGILHSHRLEYPKSYTALTGCAL